MQESKLYVGNLNYATNEDQLKEAFEPFGEVLSVNIIKGKGFGFVEFATVEQAEKAKDELNGKEFMGRALRVDKARPRRERPKRDFDNNY